MCIYVCLCVYMFVYVHLRVCMCVCVWPIVHTKQPERASGPSDLVSLESQDSQAFVGFMSCYKANEI